MARLLPDAELLTLDLLRSALPSTTFTTMIPDDVLERVPLVIVRRVSGAAIHPRFLDRATMSVDAWHTSKADAAELAESVRTALFLAWDSQTVTTHGHVAYFDETAAPSEIRADEPDTVTRYQASYSLATRPPA